MKNIFEYNYAYKSIDEIIDLINTNANTEFEVCEAVGDYVIHTSTPLEIFDDEKEFYNEKEVSAHLDILEEFGAKFERYETMEYIKKHYNLYTIQYATKEYDKK